jgi:poly(hydroxyalkanoate) depolymerase family esterase
MFDAWANMCGVNPFGWDFSHPDSHGAPVRKAATSVPPALITSRLATDSGLLEYKLYVPRSYDGEPAALLVMLHGCGQDAQDFARGTGMNELAEQYKCLVAYPEQSSAANSARCWNWFEDAHHHRGRGEPALIAGVARKIMDEFAIDSTKVFVAGLSAGAAMAVVLGRTYPDLFAAVGCHSGLAHGCAVGAGAAMQAMQYGEIAGAVNADVTAPPMIVFHGDRDATVHPRNSHGVVEQSIQLHGRLGAALSAQSETGEHSGRTFTREIHRAERRGVVVEHWTVHGTGHAWSGGRRQGSFTDENGPDASGEMMRFFLGSPNLHTG